VLPQPVYAYLSAARNTGDLVDPRIPRWQRSSGYDCGQEARECKFGTPLHVCDMVIAKKVEQSLFPEAFDVMRGDVVDGLCAVREGVVPVERAIYHLANGPFEVVASCRLAQDGRSKTALEWLVPEGV